jgi:hypothetical protein
MCAIGLIEQMRKIRHPAMRRGYSGLRRTENGDDGGMDDREAGTYSTPPEAAPGTAETRAARESTAAGMRTLFASVFIAFVVVAVVVLLVRYVF